MEHYKTQQMIRWDNETTKKVVLQEGIGKGIKKERKTCGSGKNASQKDPH